MRKYMKAVAWTWAAYMVILAGLMLSGCSSSGGLPDNVTHAFSLLSDFTLSDLRKAQAIASASGDTVGDACYSYLIPIAERQQADGGDGIKLGGAATILERGRVARMGLMASGGAAGGPCSALLQEEIRFGVMVAGRLGLGVATGGGGLLGLGFAGL